MTSGSLFMNPGSICCFRIASITLMVLRNKKILLYENLEAGVKSKFLMVIETVFFDVLKTEYRVMMHFSAFQQFTPHWIILLVISGNKLLVFSFCFYVFSILTIFIIWDALKECFTESLQDSSADTYTYIELL